MKRVLVTGGAGFISSNVIRHLLAHTPHEVVSLDALTYAGNLENLADVMSHERLSFVHGDIRDAELVADVVAEVDVIVNAAAESPRREVDRGGRVRVRDDERRGDADPARRDPAHPGRAVRAHLLERGVRHGGDRPDGRAPPAPAAQPVRGDEGRGRPARVQLLRHVRASDRDRAPVQQLRAAPASREGRAALHHAGARGRGAHDPRRRSREPRLAVRRRHTPRRSRR